MQLHVGVNSKFRTFEEAPESFLKKHSMFIDYNKPDEISSYKSIAIGSLNVNLAAVVALTVISERASKFEWAYVCFAVSLPILVFSASALDRVQLIAVSGEAGFGSGLRRFLTFSLFLALLATALGYLLFTWNFSSKAVVALAAAMLWGLILSRIVTAGIRGK